MIGIARCLCHRLAESTEKLVRNHIRTGNPGMPKSQKSWPTRARQLHRDAAAAMPQAMGSYVLLMLPLLPCSLTFYQPLWSSATSASFDVISAPEQTDPGAKFASFVSCQAHDTSLPHHCSTCPTLFRSSLSPKQEVNA